MPVFTVAVPPRSQTVPFISATILTPILPLTEINSSAEFSETSTEYGDKQNIKAKITSGLLHVPTLLNVRL